MIAILFAALRRNWRLFGTIAAFAVFTLIHLVFFRPAAARYRAALASVGGIEAVFNPGGGRPLLPPRVYSLIAANSLRPQDAVERGASGALGVVLLEDLDRIATRSGVAIVTSEPGTVSQEPLTTHVRARVLLRGRYAELIAFFDELSQSESLILVERFEIRAGNESDDLLELWVSRLYLKQAGGKP